MSDREYEIIYDRFHRRWTLKPHGLPGALQVGRTRDEVLARAVPFCGNHVCSLKIYDEAGHIEEERAFGKPSR